MNKVLISLILALAPIISAADTDYKCQGDCLSKGYQLNFCTQKCSYSENLYTPTKQTDYRCQGDCLNKGYQLNYCTSLCSF